MLRPPMPTRSLRRAVPTRRTSQRRAWWRHHVRSGHARMARAFRLPHAAPAGSASANTTMRLDTRRPGVSSQVARAVGVPMVGKPDARCAAWAVRSFSDADDTPAAGRADGMRAPASGHGAAPVRFLDRGHWGLPAVRRQVGAVQRQHQAIGADRGRSSPARRHVRRPGHPNRSERGCR